MFRDDLVALTDLDPDAKETAQFSGWLRTKCARLRHAHQESLLRREEEARASAGTTGMSELEVRDISVCHMMSALILDAARYQEGVEKAKKEGISATRAGEYCSTSSSRGSIRSTILTRSWSW